MASLFNNKGWKWIPSLYFAEGLPYILVTTVSVVMYKNLGLSNSEIAFYTSWLYLPWVIKPLWSPFVDIIKSKRWWIIFTQIILGGGMAGIAFSIGTSLYVSLSLAFFWLIAFSSATHDISADGFYMHALRQYEQSLFVGIRSIFYRMAVWFGQGVVVMAAGILHHHTSIESSWSICFYSLAGIFVLLALIHRRTLPSPASDTPNNDLRHISRELRQAVVSFFTQKNIWLFVLFIFLYRFGEAQLVKMAQPFMLDSVSEGGLGMPTETVGFIYGTIGVIALIAGGLLGGVAIAYKGLKYWILPMALSMKLPDLVYVLLSYTQTDNLWLIAASVAIEQLGYGFGFSAFMMFLIMISQSKYKTTHYALATGIMALGMMLPGMISGHIQEMVGYNHFFIWVMICTIPGIVLIPFLKIPKTFGKEKN